MLHFCHFANSQVLSMERAAVRLDQLDFDLNNPRFDPLPDQIAALQAMVDIKPPSKLVKLAEHIVENGINPAERFILVKAPKGRFIVVEGNRRFAALKLLAKPALLLSVDVPKATSTAIRRLSDDFDIEITEALDAVIFDDKTEASTWIDLKHTGENEGAGTVGWDGIQTARHRDSDPAVKLLDYARQQRLVSAATLAEKPFPITSLRRLLGDPFVRESLGLEMSKGSVRAFVPPAELHKGLKRVVNDLATGDITVTKIKTKKDREQYIGAFPKASTVQTKKRLEDAWDITDATQAAQAETQKAKRTMIQPKKARNHLIGMDCRLNIKEKRLNDIYWELRRYLKLSEHANAVATLFRVFFEFSVDYYCEQHKLATKKPNGYGLSLEAKAENVISHLEANGKLADKAATLARNHLNEKQSVSNPATFNAFIHNRRATPDPTTLLAMWANVEPIVKAVYAE